MFRTVVLAACFAMAAPSAQAQLIPSIDFGVAAGLNFASLSDTRAADLENTTGYHVGIYGDVGIPFVAARVGLYYLDAGDLATTEDGDPVASATFVTVPVDFQIQTPTPVAKAYLLIGPEARFAVDSDSEDGVVVDRNAVNLAGNVGVGAKFGSPLGGLSGFAEVRYARDLTSFAEDQGLTTENDYKLSLFMVRAGVGL